jgi:hypothetical protein
LADDVALQDNPWEKKTEAENILASWNGQ